MDSNIYNLLDEDAVLPTIQKKMKDIRERPAASSEIARSSKPITRKQRKTQKGVAMTDRLAKKLEKKSRKVKLRNKAKVN